METTRCEATCSADSQQVLTRLSARTSPRAVNETVSINVQPTMTNWWWYMDAQSSSESESESEEEVESPTVERSTAVLELCVESAVGTSLPRRLRVVHVPMARRDGGWEGVGEHELKLPSTQQTLHLTFWSNDRRRCALRLTHTDLCLASLAAADTTVSWEASEAVDGRAFVVSMTASYARANRGHRFHARDFRVWVE